MRFLLGILGGAVAACAVAAVLSESKNKARRLELSAPNSNDFWKSRIARYYAAHVN